MRHVVGSILISKYRSWCTLTFLKYVKKGKLCQNATLTKNVWKLTNVVMQIGKSHELPDYFLLHVRDNSVPLCWNVYVTLKGKQSQCLDHMGLTELIKSNNFQQQSYF